MYGQVLGLSGGLGAGAAVAALPNTGGNRGVIATVAISSVILGAAVLVSTIARIAIRRHYA
jgi:LPXTG-motif cell wall-anchored protein